MIISITNRNRAFFSILDKLPRKRKQILSMYQKHAPCSMQDICERYLLPINEVSGRTSELVDAFLLTGCGSKHNQKTGKKNTLYRPTTGDERTNHINAEYAKLTRKKDELISDYHRGISPFTKELLRREISKISKQINALATLTEVNL